jgi:hypothetical protein
MQNVCHFQHWPSVSDGAANPGPPVTGPFMPIGGWENERPAARGVYPLVQVFAKIAATLGEVKN